LCGQTGRHLGGDRDRFDLTDLTMDGPRETRVVLVTLLVLLVLLRCERRVRRSLLLIEPINMLVFVHVDDGIGGFSLTWCSSCVRIGPVATAHIASGLGRLLLLVLP